MTILENNPPTDFHVNFYKFFGNYPLSLTQAHTFKGDFFDFAEVTYRQKGIRAWGQNEQKGSLRRRIRVNL